MSNDILNELARLRREVDDLKATVFPSGKTTKKERQALHKHIEDLTAAIKAPKKPKVKKVNTFTIGQIVMLKRLPLGQENTRTKGSVFLIACKAALPSIRTCDPKKCEHAGKTHVWVNWPDKKMFSYHFSQLVEMTAEDIKPRIGKELSGRIGEWVFDAKTRLWQKDGSDKQYTESEFDDVVYFDTHPYAKEEGEAFIKKLMKKETVK